MFGVINFVDNLPNQFIYNAWPPIWVTEHIIDTQYIFVCFTKLYVVKSFISQNGDLEIQVVGIDR